MRRSEQPGADFEFPGRYYLDETRFSGGSERSRNCDLQSHSSHEEAKA